MPEDIFPVGSGPEDAFLLHVKQSGQIAADPFRGRSRKSHDAPETVFFKEIRQSQIIGPETVAPFGQAMGLVHNEQAGRNMLQRLFHP